jgi:hypothetical protein
MAVDFKQLVKRLKEDKSNVRDRDWIRHSFMVGGKDVDETWASLRFYSSGDRKFSDTSLGGSLA